MSFYNMLFGMNPKSDLLLAVLGLQKHDVERFRDCFLDSEPVRIIVYTRTGGGNRESYPNLTMRKLPTWRGSVDDSFDSTYCMDTFEVPPEWRDDVAKLGDIIGNGIRQEFGQHLAKTLRREPTEADVKQAAYDQEQAELRRTAHVLANGHTFVPYTDGAMETALKIAEKNGGELRSAWGILPLKLDVKTSHFPYPNAREERDRSYMIRVEIGYDWTIDVPYWEHCQRRFAADYPVTMRKIAESVEQHLGKAA